MTQFMVHAKPSAALELRRQQQALILASPVLADQFPDLKSLALTLSFCDADGVRGRSEVKCTLNLLHARARQWYACPAGTCSGGNFDLTGILAEAVAARLPLATGQLNCQGTRKRADRTGYPCQTHLHYALALRYQPKPAAPKRARPAARKAK